MTRASIRENRIHHIRRILLEGRPTEEVLDHLAGLLEEVETPAEMRYFGGVSLFAAMLYEQAIAFFKDAIQLGHPAYPALLACSACYLKLGNLGNALMHYKLAQVEQDRTDQDQYLLVLFDFLHHLGQWREDEALLEARQAEKRGMLEVAYQQYKSFVENRDPTPALYQRLIGLGLRLGHHAEALAWSVELHKSASSIESRLTVAALLSTLDEQESFDRVYDSLGTIDAPELALEALQLGRNRVSPEVYGQQVRSWWNRFGQPGVPEAGQEVRGNSQADETFKVAFILGDFSFMSPAVWFMPTISGLLLSDCWCDFYLDDADSWGLRAFERGHSGTVMETSKVDSATLRRILQRNEYDLVVHLGGLSRHGRIDALPGFAGAPVLAWVDHPAHLVQKEAPGFDGILLKSDDESAAPHWALSDFVLTPPPSPNRWAPPETIDQVLVLAIRPGDLMGIVPILAELLLRFPLLLVSVDETILGDTGVQSLLDLLEKVSEEPLADRFRLFQQAQFLDPQSIIDHVSGATVYVSSGCAGYDYQAVGQRVLTVCTPASVPLTDNPLPELLTRAGQSVLVPETWAEFTQEIGRLLDAPDYYRNRVAEYQEGLDRTADSQVTAGAIGEILSKLRSFGR